MPSRPRRSVDSDCSESIRAVAVPDPLRAGAIVDQAECGASSLAWLQRGAA